MLRNYNHFYTQSPHFQGLKCNWTNNYNHKILNNFNILLRILCRQWPSWVWNSWTSPETGFPPLWCFARLLLQLTSVVVCLWVFLPLVLSSVSEMHAQSGWDKEIDSSIAEYSTFLPSKTPGLLLQYVLGHRPFVLWSAAQSTLLHLIESGQRVYPYTLQNSSGWFCLLSRHQ